MSGNSFNKSRQGVIYSSINKTSAGRNDLLDIMYSYKGPKPSRDIVDAALNLMDIVCSKGYRFRENKRKGLFGICLYYKSIELGDIRTKREISQILNVDEKFMAKGDKILAALNDCGEIHIQKLNDPLLDCLNKYLPTLGINKKYGVFIRDLIDRAEKKRLHVMKNPRVKTKCTGCIYLLCKRIPQLNHLSAEQIANACDNMNKNTMIAYYDMLMQNLPILKKIFGTHHIPLPITYKRSVISEST
jgi:transcription initiation factor TFIIIB Brf1 subunit/transcription initiation factor TFIIB